MVFTANRTGMEGRKCNGTDREAFTEYTKNIVYILNVFMGVHLEKQKQPLPPFVCLSVHARMKLGDR